jgi:hypothetical protein
MRAHEGAVVDRGKEKKRARRSLNGEAPLFMPRITPSSHPVPFPARGTGRPVREGAGPVCTRNARHAFIAQRLVDSAGENPIGPDGETTAI